MGLQQVIVSAMARGVVPQFTQLFFTKSVGRQSILLPIKQLACKDFNVKHNLKESFPGCTEVQEFNRKLTQWMRNTFYENLLVKYEKIREQPSKSRQDYIEKIYTFKDTSDEEQALAGNYYFFPLNFINKTYLK